MDLSKLTKKQSGVIFLIVYALTLVLGFIIYYLGILAIGRPVLSMLIADVVMTIVVFFIGTVIKNASLYDPYWSLIPPFLLVFWMVSVGPLINMSIILLLIVLIMWSVRLTYNWWKNWTGFQEQDWRYDLLRDKNRKLFPITNFFGIHMIPTVIVYIQMINVYDSMSSNVNVVFIIGFLISLSAPIIQYFADKQMFEFRMDNVNKKSIINTGLWKYSRHPNYFGELSFWVGIYIMYFAGVMKFDLNIIYPILMILLFVFISIPMMEKKLKFREGYQEYKDSVSMIIPFFPKKTES
jgi:steroid 5-alpha reductase family enzyme